MELGKTKTCYASQKGDVCNQGFKLNVFDTFPLWTPIWCKDKTFFCLNGADIWDTSLAVEIEQVQIKYWTKIS